MPRTREKLLYFTSFATDSKEKAQVKHTTTTVRKIGFTLLVALLLAGTTISSLYPDSNCMPDWLACERDAEGEYSDCKLRLDILKYAGLFHCDSIPNYTEGPSEQKENCRKAVEALYERALENTCERDRQEALALCRSKFAPCVWDNAPVVM